MKNDLIFIVQKCICIDFLINATMSCNMYKHLNLLTNFKKQNLTNIKVLCHIYKQTYNNELLLKNTPIIKIEKNTENILDTLLTYNLDVLTKIDILRKQYFHSSSRKIFQGLYDSYLNLISYINCFYPLTPKQNTNSIAIEVSNLNNSYNYPTFFEILNYSDSEIYLSNKIELIRDICIKAIYLFFAYNIEDDLIVVEYYEIFFENNPENKFYQYFFNLDVGYFKIRIYDKSLVVFYVYQSPKNIITISTPPDKDSSKSLVDIYLKETFKDEFNNFYYDKNYINTSYYKDSIESYKFKYIYKNRGTKKCLYVSININFNMIQELQLI